MGKLGTKKTDHLETFEKKGKLYLKYLESRNTRLKSAIIHSKISDIGKIKPKVREINLNVDRKQF